MVKRYDIDCHVVELYEQPYGEAVMYEDYKKLMDIANRLDEAIDLHMGEFCESKLRSEFKAIKNG